MNMKQMKKCIFALVVVLVLAVAAPAAMWYGPTPYLQFSDSPFSGLSFISFSLEDFDDGLLNTPGVTASAGQPYVGSGRPVGFVDSVDADDGLINGVGNVGPDPLFDSWVQLTATAGVTFTFDASVLGSLPTHAGIVWTDSHDSIEFEAFDAGGVSLGSLGPVALSDGVFNSTTAEDRFFGVSDPAGVWKIHIRSSGAGGIEMDHLQYGVVPVPGAVLLGILGLSVVGIKLRKFA